MRFLNLTKKLKLFNKSRIISDVVIMFLITLLIYIHNLSPSVYGGDSGDFIVAAITKGVAHPSGYPLETVLGILTLLLPIDKSPAWKMGLISAFFSSLSVVLMYLITFNLTKKRWLSFISSLTLAFTYPFWLYAEVVEVFALHSFFMLAITFFTIKFNLEKKERYLYYLALVIGLSLTNNLTILLIFPAIALTILSTNWKVILNIRLLFFCLLLMLLGLGFYLYIPIAASHNPVYSWGRAVTFKNFLALISRQDYGWKIGSGYEFDILILNIKTYLIYLKYYVTLVPIIISLVGAIYLICKKNIKINALLFLMFLFLGPIYLIISKVELTNYGLVGILERFYLSSIVSLLLFLPFGILSFYELLEKLLKYEKTLKLMQNIFIIAFFIIPVSVFFRNYKSTNLSNVYIGDNLGKDILSTLPENSILILSDDSSAFSALYAQYGLGFRKDVFIPGNQGGKDQFLKEMFYKNYFKSDEELNKFMITARNKVDRNLFYSGIAPIIDTGVSVFTDTEFSIVDDKYDQFNALPQCLTFQILSRNEINKINEEDYLNKIESTVRGYNIAELVQNKQLTDNIIFAHIRRLYTRCYLNISKYLFEKYNDKQKSIQYFNKTSEIDPLNQ